MPQVFRSASFLVAITLVVCMVLQKADPGEAQVGAGATLVVLGGGVTVATAAGIGPGTTGQSLNPGDQVTTSANGRALVTFFEGSEVELDSNAALQIAEMNQTGGQTSIGLNAVAGSSVHKVLALSDPGSTYRVSAGSTVLLVRGTIFGHRRDPATDDVTMALAQCGRTPLDAQDCVDFPAPGQRVRVGEKVTSKRDGSVVREQFTPGGSLFNDIQVPAGSGGSVGATTFGMFKSADDCIQQKAITEGMPFADALAFCAEAMTPPPPPPPPPPLPSPPLAPEQTIPIASAFQPSTDSVGSSEVTVGPITVEPDDDDNDNRNGNDNSNDNDKKSTKKKKPAQPTHQPARPTSHGCSC
jgi:hypothetical protein